MEAEYWILTIFAVVIALAAGFIGGGTWADSTCKCNTGHSEPVRMSQ